ncbi:hypothetical protein CDG77_18400 [Nostoc sp. 'Peltigera membranacea cyanobiont' 213]|nr:hypothetical protein CDG77_18400 [Nostoc sp. 'Peltigera membranacea cyanobiont' 213]
MGMFEDALSLYDRAIIIDDGNPMYYNNRAAALKRLGRLQEAIKQYEEIILRDRAIAALVDWIEIK